VVVVPATLLGLAVFGVRARTSSVNPLSTLSTAQLNGIAVLVALALGGAWLVWGRLRPRLLSDLTVAATATYVSGSLMLVLAGTPWGLYGLFGDQQFRTQMVTRFSTSLGSADAAYRGLPSHYPPMVPWIEGHAAVVLGLPAWEMVKYGQLALDAAVPILAYLLWRRVVDAPRAAVIVALTSVFNADPYKPDEWLVLALLVPWWIDAIRDYRGPRTRAWPAWLHGVLAGLLLTTYSFYFLPLAVATVAGLVADLVRRRPWRPILVRYLVVAAVGLVVSAWYWLPLVLVRLRGIPADSLQMRWLDSHVIEVPLLSGGALGGGLVLLGIVYLVAAAGRRPVAEAVLLVALAAYVVIGGGLLLAVLNRPMLGWKADVLAVQALLIGGVLALFELGRLARRLAGSISLVDRALTALVTVTALAGTLHFVGTWVSGTPVVDAHITRLPNGSLPKPGRTAGQRRSWPSALQLRHALGGDVSTSSVVVTTNSTLFATTPIHLFTPAISIYSNPFGQFDARLRFLQRLAATRDPQQLTRLARHNSFDPIDAFILVRRQGGYAYQLSVDNYPNDARILSVIFHLRQFARSDWRITRLPGAAVITYR
jgi:galactan 5-O-arabinofuranosyltransferase